jgi:hypothetical protein
MTGCTNPRAINYNPSADEDDGSCVYLQKVGDACYAFQDVDVTKLKNKSFTLSYSVEGNAWVFYHDYIPDFYFSTRQQLYTLKNNSIWIHNKGLPGRYYKDVKNSFFMDIVFAFENEVLLNSVQWVTQVLDAAGKIKPFRTITSLTIWNDSQCTGELDLPEFLSTSGGGVSKSRSEFSFNDFADIVKSDTEFFMQSVFDNLRPESTTLDKDMPWYEKGYMQNNHFIIRFEFNNDSGDKLLIHSADVAVQETYK